MTTYIFTLANPSYYSQFVKTTQFVQINMKFVSQYQSCQLITVIECHLWKIQLYESVVLNVRMKYLNRNLNYKQLSEGCIW